MDGRDGTGKGLVFIGKVGEPQCLKADLFEAEVTAKRPSTNFWWDEMLKRVLNLQFSKQCHN